MSVCDLVSLVKMASFPGTWPPNRKQPEISFCKVSATEIPCQRIYVYGENVLNQLSRLKWCVKFPG